MTKPQSKLPMVANATREVDALRAEPGAAVKGSAEVASTLPSTATTTGEEERWAQ